MVGYGSTSKPSGNGYARLHEVLRQIGHAETERIVTHLEFATAITSNSIELDKDGYQIYYDEGDFLVLNGVTFEAGDRLLVMPITGPRSQVMVIGRWQKSTEVRDRVSHPIYLVPAGGIKTSIVPEDPENSGPTFDSVTSTIPFNRNWFAPQSSVKIVGRTISGGDSLNVKITDGAKGIVYNEGLGTEFFEVDDLSIYNFGDTDDNEIEVEVSYTDASGGIGHLVSCALLVREP